MLINKFKLKYGHKPNLSKYIDNEVHRFLANDRLTEDNLKNLDTKIGKEAQKKDRQDAISQRSQSAASKKMASGRSGQFGLKADALKELNSRNS